MENKTGWIEDDGIWYLYYEGEVLAVFCLTEHSNPTKVMCDIKIIHKYAEEIELPSGDVDEAKEIIENMIISYCSSKIDKWYLIRWEVLKITDKRKTINRWKGEMKIDA